ncbi:MAG: hypothetical protein AABZ74_10565 [Cyanobacteriota bacterium]
MQTAIIPNKMVQTWNADVHAIIDTWISYYVTLNEFSDAVLSKGLEYSKLNKGRAWIVDSSDATGNFSKEIQEFIGSDIFPAFAKAGIKYFITITSKNALTKLTIRNYSAKAGPNGLLLVQIDSLADAIEWLKKNP